jgi:RimJ/RimL family protein N-acetyltransferase
MSVYITGSHVDLREIANSDAEFILSLRSDPELGKYLSVTDLSIEQQLNWIQQYHEKNVPHKQEWYFIVQNKNSEPVGTIRIYDIQNDNFCWGSWIILPNARHYATLESIVLLYDYAFLTLGFNKTHFDARIANQKAVNFYLRFGAKIVKQDDLNYYFSFEKQDYMNQRESYLSRIHQITTKKVPKTK